MRGSRTRKALIQVDLCHEKMYRYSTQKVQPGGEAMGGVGGNGREGGGGGGGGGGVERPCPHAALTSRFLLDDAGCMGSASTIGIASDWSAFSLPSRAFILLIALSLASARPLTAFRTINTTNMMTTITMMMATIRPVLLPVTKARASSATGGKMSNVQLITIAFLHSLQYTTMDNKNTQILSN